MNPLDKQHYITNFHKPYCKSKKNETQSLEPHIQTKRKRENVQKPRQKEISCRRRRRQRKGGEWLRVAMWREREHKEKDVKLEGRNVLTREKIVEELWGIAIHLSHAILPWYHFTVILKTWRMRQMKQENKSFLLVLNMKYIEERNT